MNDTAVRVLLVEDDEDLLELLSEELRGYGYSVVGHGSAEMALASGSLTHVDIVVADVNLPGESGVELAQHVREVSSTPLILMTTSHALDIALSALRIGVREYLIKPVTGPTLDQKIREILDASMQPNAKPPPAVRLEAGVAIPGTPYRIVRALQSGGMGDVLEATHLELARRVAVKVMHKQLSADSNAVATFRNEARLTANMGAANVVDILDFSTLPDGRLMYVMEYLDGITVAEELDSGRIAPGRALGIARQLCRGLHVAHQAGVVHRDLKPENLMLVTREGRPDFVKILDFGIAGLARADRPGTDHFGFTPGYAAPEQVRGEPYDHRVDVFGVGGVLYAMLTGDAAFSDSLLPDEPAMPPSLTVDSDEIPDALDDLVMACLEEDPKLRPASMVEVDRALREIRANSRLRSWWDDLPAIR